MVESANKLVVEARFKGSGMRWKRSNVNPMLALRNGVCNERWQETWHMAGQQCRNGSSHHRHERGQDQKPNKRRPFKPDLLSPTISSSFHLYLFFHQNRRP